MSAGSSALDILARERDNILRAEVAALLHDIGKFCDRHYDVESRENADAEQPARFAFKIVVDNPGEVVHLQDQNALGPMSNKDSKVYGELVSQINPTGETTADYLNGEQKHALMNTAVRLQGNDYSIAELVILSRPDFGNAARLTRLLGKPAWPISLLSSCHNKAHNEKQTPAENKQSRRSVWQSSVFGYEGMQEPVDVKEGFLTPHLQALPFDRLADRSAIVPILRDALNLGLGDTRRPINEVTLWDWSSAVAALYKSAIAGVLLTGRSDPLPLRWRLLRVSYDGLAFLERAGQVTDLLGRREAVRQALDGVRQLLEVTYPLGNEIYRDENGSAFVVPALDDATGLRRAVVGEVESKVRTMFLESALKGELVPIITISDSTENASSLPTLLANVPSPNVAFLSALEEWWRGDTANVCTVCGFRPQGWGAPSPAQHAKAQARNVCHVCLTRRGTRARDWAAEDEADWQRTIWLDELADRHGRLALLVGRFDLAPWLSGTNVSTLLVTDSVESKDARAFTGKNPSIARLRRVWETTRRFWDNVQRHDLTGSEAADRRRLIIAPLNAGALDLGRFHVYDADIGDTRTSLVWNPDRRVLITADDLGQLAVSLGAPRPEARKPSVAADYVIRHLPESIPLYEPGGYGQVRRPIATAQLNTHSPRVSNVPYAPVIPLLMEPRTFMALIPAEAALDAVARISARYSREMGKVRNRLGFFLGTVFFDRRTPLFAALDAGRRLLEVELPSETVRIGDAPVRCDGHSHLVFDNGIAWDVPVRMGNPDLVAVDPTLIPHDTWYPYYQVKADAAGQAPTGRKRQFTRDEPNGVKRHWVHVENLAAGDEVNITPARFAYLYLDTSARRFEAAQPRFWWLEHVGQMQRLWAALQARAAEGQITDTALRGMDALFTAKRETWGLDKDLRAEGETDVSYDERLDAFTMLVDATVQQAGLHGANGDSILPPEMVVNGLFAATLDLYVRILKQRLAPSREERPAVKEPG